MHQTPLASLPPHHPADREALERCFRVFGPRALSQYAIHLDRLRNGPQWFAYVGSSGARYFTRLIKLEKPVKNPRSITGSPKYIVRAANDGFLF